MKNNNNKSSIVVVSLCWDGIEDDDDEDQAQDTVCSALTTSIASSLSPDGDEDDDASSSLDSPKPACQNDADAADDDGRGILCQTPELTTASTTTETTATHRMIPNLAVSIEKLPNNYEDENFQKGNDDNKETTTEKRPPHIDRSRIEEGKNVPEERRNVWDEICRHVLNAAGTLFNIPIGVEQV